MLNLRDAVEESYSIDNDGKVKLIDNDSVENKQLEEKPIKNDETITLYYDFIERLEEAYQRVDTIDFTLKDYSKEYKEKQVDKIWEYMDNDRVETGNKILSIIDARIKKAKSEQELKVRDTRHQLLISNALEMLKMLDKDATAYQINNIIAPFVERNDYQTLSIIKTYLDNKFPGGLLDAKMEEVDFPTLIVSDEFRHTKMRETFKDLFFSNSAKYMRLQGGLAHEIMIRTTGSECGYYDINKTLNSEE